MAPLDDGTYDALVIDADLDDGAITMELTIVGGPHKGEVVSVRSEDAGGDPLTMLGLPATLTVSAGELRVRIEP